jgi:hypothetical protein
VVAVAELLGLPTVPVVARGSFGSSEELQHLMETKATQPSALNTCPSSNEPPPLAIGSDEQVLPEGFVVRAARGFTHDDFSSCMGKVHTRAIAVS